MFWQKYARTGVKALYTTTRVVHSKQKRVVSAIATPSVIDCLKTPPDSAPAFDREDLTKRVLPKMILSTGDKSSLTAATAPVSSTISPEMRAKLRFSVRGNAIVTGGAGTLGYGAARALLEHGLAGLMIFDVNQAEAERKIHELRAEFPASTIYSKIVNITDDAAVTKAVVETVEELGSVDILLCFAGVVGCVHAIDMTGTEFKRVLDINTTGSFLCARAASNEMIKQGSGGSIVFIASISGHRVNYPQPQVAYNVSKSAVITLKNSLAAEFARYGIRVNSISPGYMDTILNEGEGIAEARQIWTERNPMGRMGTPDELTGAVVLLSSAAGSYMTGMDMIIDGGQVLF